MIFRIVTLSLLLASSNALLLRGNGGVNREETKKKERKLASPDGAGGGCGKKLSAETMIAFGLDPLMNCTAIARSDIPCVTIAELNNLVPADGSTCTTSEDCTLPSNCYYLPNPGGPTSQPVANCFVDRAAAADWVALQPDGEPVNEDVPKEICRELQLP